MIRSWLYRSGTGLALAALTVLFTAGAAFAQTSRIEGTVRSAASGDPIAGARVTVVGTTLAGATNENGYYAIENVPVGTYNVRVAVIGFQPVTITNQVVSAGLPTTVNFTLQASILRIEGVVVTGVAEQTEVVKLPFTVDQISGEDLPVPPITAEESIRGKVAGARVIRNQGLPGSGVSVILRGATSLNTSGRSNEPLYVVDGVILGASMVDVDALDIESIEVVKGAAASALYGARAANGVISVTTRRGRDIPEGDTKIIFRTELGVNNIENPIDQAQAHWYLLSDCTPDASPNPNGPCIAGASATDADTTISPDDRAWASREINCAVGSLNCDPLNPGLGFQMARDLQQSVCPAGFTEGVDCSAAANSYLISDNPFTGTTYDNLDRFFDPGQFYTHTVSLSHRTGTTNFLASFHESKQTGIVDGREGYLRRGGRVNIDHQLGGNFDFSASAFYSQSVADDPEGGSSTFYDLNFYPIDVNLLERYTSAEQRIADGIGTTIDTNDYLIAPDFQVQEENPIYGARNAEVDRRRSRIMGNFRLRWRPIENFDVETDFSFDRSDRNNSTYNFVGYRSLIAGSINLGRYAKSNDTDQAINWAGTVAYTNSFDQFNVVLKARGLLERVTSQSFNASGRDLAASDVRDLDVAQDQDLLSIGSSSSEVRSLGYFVSGQFDYADRYILDALVRRDGSSLFGEDERWNTYYRLSGAWRMAQESWWPLGIFDEFKLRGSIGTAGGRPRFSAQYETYSVNGGVISKGVLGNSFLKPEYARETEVGVDLLAAGRLSLSVNYVKNNISDQILAVPLPGFFGFGSQWRNAGTINATTWEGTLQWAVIQNPSFSWNVNFVIDRTRQQITEFELPAYQDGPGGLWYIRNNEKVGQMYAARWTTACNEIYDPSGGTFLYSDATSCLTANGGDFELNDDGYLVPVGAQNSYTQGMTDSYFGSTIDIQGVTYDWGLPFEAWDTLTNPGTGLVDTTNFLPVGNSVPDFNWGLGNTFRIGGFSLYALFDAQVGGDVYNNTRQWAARDGNANWVDQSGKPVEQRKSWDYTQRLYYVNAPNSFFTLDGSFIKFRELSVSYTFNRNQLEPLFGNFVKRVRLSFIGRNLLTITDYEGYDPEVSEGGNAAVYRYDGFEYPNFRTLTGSIEVEF